MGVEKVEEVQESSPAIAGITCELCPQPSPVLRIPFELFRNFGVYLGILEKPYLFEFIKRTGTRIPNIKLSTMSRAFVKEDDQEEAPIIPPRAALPPGETNYVTPAGYDALISERNALEEEKRSTPKDNETEHRRAVTLIDGKLKLLNERIVSAQVLRPDEVAQSEVRFGAIVTLKNGTDQQRLQIVGVDEADPKQDKIAFTAPIARVLMGKKPGDTAELRMRGKTQKLKVVEVRYGDSA